MSDADADTLVPPETIGQRIRRLRIDGGLTQNELGSLLGHPPVMRHDGAAQRSARTSHRVQDWEAGDSAPKIVDIADVARALHCSCDYLLTGGGDR